MCSLFFWADLFRGILWAGSVVSEVTIRNIVCLRGEMCGNRMTPLSQAKQNRVNSEISAMYKAHKWLNSQFKKLCRLRLGKGGEVRRNLILKRGKLFWKTYLINEKKWDGGWEGTKKRHLAVLQQCCWWGGGRISPWTCQLPALSSLRRPFWIQCLPGLSLC